MIDFNLIIGDLLDSSNRLIHAIRSTQVAPEREPLIFSAIFDNFIEKTIAHYSADHSKEIITESLLEAISAMEDGFVWKGFKNSYAMYDQMVWMLSLGILCNISEEDFTRIAAIIKRDGATDKLLATLTDYRLPDYLESYSESFIQKSPYAHLEGIFSATNQNAAFIKNYLDTKWYKGHKDAPWHDSHKNTKANTHFGYWAWEVAALVKIFGIDDSSLNNQQYYPYKAVHWDDLIV